MSEQHDFTNGADWRSEIRRELAKTAAASSQQVHLSKIKMVISPWQVDDNGVRSRVIYRDPEDAEYDDCADVGVRATNNHRRHPSGGR